MQKVPRHCLVSQSFFLEVTAIKVVCFCIYVYLSRHSSFPFIFKVIFLNKLSIFMFQNSKGIKWCTVKTLTLIPHPSICPLQRQPVLIS